MKSWESDPWFQTTPKQRYDAAIAKLNVRAAERQEECTAFAYRLRNRGWDVTPEWVSDHLAWVEPWANGLIAIGHLINRCGMKKMSRAAYMEWSTPVSDAVAVMLDTVGTSAANIPGATKYVGGYITGSGAVPWSAGDWALFPNARKVRIYQNPGQGMALEAWDVIDLENGAFTVAEAVAETKRRVDAGITWTYIYATRSNLAAFTAALKAEGTHYWNGHVMYWLADWNLNEAEAAALIGTFVEGATCIGVQWASPTSNPNTVVPGGSHTLAQANVDISVVDANWMPSSAPAPVTPPVPTAVTHHAELVEDDGHGSFTAKPVSSTDDTHWQ